MPHGKNHFVNKQDETWAEVDVEGKYLRVLIPDNKYAYGDNESVAQMAQDVVGKHADNSDTAATKAYEQAREQLETTNFKAVKRQQAIERLNAKRPKFVLLPHEDDFGTIKGYTVLTQLTYPDGRQELKNKYLSVEDIAKHMG
jgi:hypothetical protein